MRIFLFLGSCSMTQCSWNTWSAWSATCGDMSRKRTVNQQSSVVNKLSCDGLKTDCNDFKTETQNVKIPCK